ncbi:MAG TPA: alpha/beta fold hydrolase [Verrucomicrobiae bacterium]|nr:alpha/beta fold hydrolase [Verrucomicrobiae bacterium]
MKLFLALFVFGASTLAVVLALSASGELPRQVPAGQNRLRMHIIGEGSPAVVFDCFGPANLEIWNRVQPEVARFARAVAYDHGGYWGSEPGPKPRDARQIARELHAALRNANVRPPFILVGYSFGGPYVRVYAGMYPEDVAGIVLVDPTQEGFMTWLSQHYPEINRVTEKHRIAQDELGSQWLSLNQARETQLPDVPLALITGMKPQDMLTRKLLPRWLEAHRNWLKEFPRAKHVVTTNSGHDVVFNEPGLVIHAVREMADSIRKKE